MDRIEFSTYKGKKILIEDFTNMTGTPEFFEQLKAAQKIIASQPAKSVLAVFDATNTHYNTEMLNSIKEFTKANSPFVKAAAVVGIEGLLKIALTAVGAASGRPFVTFPDRQSAMEWLIAQ
jgi:hypothetical protein